MRYRHGRGGVRRRSPGARGRLTVEQHRPWKDGLLVVAVVLVAGVGGYVAYWQGRATSQVTLSTLGLELERESQSNASLQSENTSLREQLAILERATQVERKAYLDVDHYVKGLQTEIFDLKEEVAFYRGIVASTKSRGLNIQSFSVEPRGRGREYSYRLVLTRHMNNDNLVSGTIDVSVAGEQNGLAKQFSLAELHGAARQGIEFRFRYFQKIEGQFKLPQDFAPRRVVVQVRTESKGGRAQTEKTFDWPGTA